MLCCACCGYTLTYFPISIRLTSLALWQSNDCPSASKATLMNMDKYFMWIHYERLHNHNKAKHNKTVCIFLGIYCNYRFSHLVFWFELIYCITPHTIVNRRDFFYSNKPMFYCKCITSWCYSDGAAALMLLHDLLCDVVKYLSGAPFTNMI